MISPLKGAMLDFRLRESYEQLRDELLQDESAGKLERPLGYWTVPSDKGLPFALLDQPLRELGLLCACNASLQTLRPLQLITGSVANSLRALGIQGPDARRRHISIDRSLTNGDTRATCGRG